MPDDPLFGGLWGLASIDAPTAWDTITGTGKVVYAHQGKRHGMIKRTNKQIRNLRGTTVLFKTDGDNIKKYFLPNG